MDLDEIRRLASSSSSCTVDGEVDRDVIDDYAGKYPVMNFVYGMNLPVMTGHILMPIEHIMAVG